MSQILAQPISHSIGISTHISLFRSLSSLSFLFIPFHRAGFVLHSAIHAARPDIKAIIHLHHPPCVAVSAMKCGLLPASQEAAIVGEVSYHEYKGILVDVEERQLIGRNLGFNKVCHDKYDYNQSMAYNEFLFAGDGTEESWYCHMWRIDRRSTLSDAQCCACL